MSGEKTKLLSIHTFYESLAIAGGLTLYLGIRMSVANNPQFTLVNALLSFVFTFVVAFFITVQNHGIVNWLQKKYPWQKNNVKRIVIEFVITSLGAGVIVSVIYLLLVYFLGAVTDEPVRVQVVDHIGIAIAINLIMTGIAETSFLVRQWKKSIVEQEALKRQHAESQYQALNNQVNPHFLFNSLNTLASLIPRSKEKSLEFINRFSSIYRYILDSGSKFVAELGEEVDFIQSFVFLQKARFGDDLHVNISIENKDLTKLVPPLSLQLLVENALKHNEISTNRPLELKIFTENNALVVTNNYQPRKEHVNPSGHGLENLKNRFAYLTDRALKTGVEHGFFIARLPLIEDVEG